MLKRLKIGPKILLAFAVVAIVTVGTIAVVSFTIGQATLERESFNKLTAVREMKANQIEDYFQLISDQIITQSEDLMIIKAMKEFSEGYQTIETDVPLAVGTGAALTVHYQNEFLERLVPNLLREVNVEEYLPKNPAATILQDLYIVSNPFETGSKHLLDNAGDDSSYSAAHELYHPIIRDFLDHFGYYDIFLVDLEGNIVYSVFKEVDFGTSLTEGPYSETNFARAVRAALEAEDTETVIVEDFEPYHPSYNAPASFMASPIYDGEEKIGVLVFQAPIDRINNIMTNDQNWADVGLGDSGETYLVGPDFLLRNQSRFLIEDSENYFKAIDESGVPLATMGQIRNLNSTIGLQEVITEGTQAALSGETGTDIFPDYRDVSVLSAYKPLDIAGLEWVIMSEIDEAEAFAAINWLALRLGIASIALIAFIAIAAYFFARSLTRPLAELTGEAEQLSYGVLDLQISNRDRKDEIGILANNFEVMRLSLKKSIDDLALLNKNLEDKVIERTAELEASERQSNAIIELSSDAIVVIDEESNVLVWNAKAEELFGRSREEMSGSPMDMIIPESHGKLHEHALDQAIKNRRLKSPGVTHELSALHKDGQEFPIELSLSQWEIGGKSYFSASLRDITERKRMEAEIADQLAFTRNVIDTIPNPIFVKDSEQRYTLFNRAYKEAYGIDTDALIGKTVLDFELLDEETRKIYYEKDAQLISSGDQYKDESEVRFADGELHTVLQWGTPYKLADGSLGGVVGVTADITEQKLAARTIRDREERLRAFTTALPDLAFIIDEDGRNVAVLSADEEMILSPIEEIEGQTFHDALPDELANRFLNMVQQALASGETQSIEYELEVPAGNKWFEVRCAPILESLDDKRLVVWLSRDITLRKEAEAQLHLQSSALKAAANGIVITNTQGAIEWVNPAFSDLTGYSFDEAIGQDTRILNSGQHDQLFYKDMWDTIGAGQVWQGELINKRQDGTLYTEEMTITPVIDAEGEISQYVAIKQDISERKRAEQAIREREERIRSIVEIAPDAIISIDGEQNITMFNTRAEQVFGYSVDEVLGQPLTMLMPEASHAVHPQEINKFQNEAISVRSMDTRRAIRGRRKDGTIFPAEAGISKLELDGQIIFTTFFRDITERVEMEQAIRESESRFRSLFEDSPISLWEEDFSGAKQYIDELRDSGVDDWRQHFDQNPDSIGKISSLVKIVRVNQATLDLYDAASEEELFGSLDQVFTEQSTPYFTAQMIALSGGATTYQDETTNRKLNGESFDCIVDLSIAPGYEDNWEKVFVSVADISQLKELERQLAVANERMSTELNFARDIQISMLPLIFPAFPDRREVTVHAALDSAREVGGDFYDFYFLDDEHLCFVVGDVSGKGAPGALMMAVSKTLIKSRAADDNEPASILTHVNDELAQDNVSSMFVTVFLGILNVKTGDFVYTNAGHNPPYIRRKDGSIQKIDAFHGPVIGAMPGMPYDQDKDRLYEGDVILVYSDGVTEAFSEDDELFSEERLEELLQNKSITSDKDVVEATQQALTKFVGEAEQSDDITLLAVQYLLSSEAGESHELHLTIKNQYEEMAVVETQFAEFAEENELPDSVRQSVSIALDEMLNNTISYAYHGEKEKEIEIEFELSGNRLVLTIKDSGVPFNPFSRGTPDITMSIEEREIGGLGIHMVRNMMDEVSYQRQINKNVVTLVKLLEE